MDQVFTPSGIEDQKIYCLAVTENYSQPLFRSCYLPKVGEINLIQTLTLDFGVFKIDLSAKIRIEEGAKMVPKICDVSLFIPEKTFPKSWKASLLPKKSEKESSPDSKPKSATWG